MITGTIAKLAILLGLDTSDITAGVAYTKDELREVSAEAVVAGTRITYGMSIGKAGVLSLRQSVTRLADEVLALNAVEGSPTVGLRGMPQVLAGILAVEAKIKELQGKKATATVDVRGVAEGLVAIAALRSALRDVNREGEVKQAGLLGSIGAGVATQKLLGFGAGAGAGLGGGGGGFGGFLLGGLIPGGGAAGAGSIGAFAGLGIEHLVTLVIGFIGSAIGAALGGGILAAGSLGVLAVGGGSDLAVMKSTITDTQTLGKAYQQLQQAQLLYGKNSTQAAAATLNLNQQMAILGNTAGVKAEMGVAKAGVALDNFWDKQTSQARVAASAILMQIIGLGHDYVPKVAQAAQQNLSIINTDLKPLFAWLEGPQGMGIFNDLEAKFKTDLPYSIGAFTQAVELALKLVDLASQSTGGFMQRLDSILTRLNSNTIGTGFGANGSSTSGFAQMRQLMAYLIDDFRVWWALIKQVGITIFDVFSLDVGTIKSVLQFLTQTLKTLDNYLTSANGSQQVRSVFAAHKQEILTILGLLVTLLADFGQIYLTLAPAFTNAFTTILGIIAKIVDALSSNPFGAWILGIGLILTKMGLISVILNPLVSTIKGAGIAAWNALTPNFMNINTANTDTFTAAVTKFGLFVDQFGGTTGAEGAGIAGAGALGADAAEGGGFATMLKGLGGLSGIVASVLTIGAGIFGGNQLGLAIGGKQNGGLGGALGAVGGGAAGGALAGMKLGPWGALIGAVVGAIAGSIPTVVNYWPQITKAIGSFFGTVGGWFQRLPGQAVVWFHAAMRWLTTMFGDIGKWFSQQIGKIPGIAATVWHAITSFVGSVAHWWMTLNWDKIANNVGKAIGSFAAAVVHWFINQIGKIPGVMQTIGQALGTWIAAVVKWFIGQLGKIPGTLVTIGGALGSWAAAIVKWFAGQILKIPGVIATVGSALGSFVATLVIDIILLVLKIPGLVGTIWGAIVWFFGQIINVIRGLGNWISNIFSNLFGGIVNGITGKNGVVSPPTSWKLTSFNIPLQNVSGSNPSSSATGSGNDPTTSLLADIKQNTALVAKALGSPPSTGTQAALRTA